MERLKAIYRRLLPVWFREAVQNGCAWSMIMARSGLFALFSLFPVQNKAVFSTFEGKKYGDNPQFIAQELHRLSPETDIVWVRDDACSYAVPAWMRTVSGRKHLVRRIWEYATAQVWVDSHRLAPYLRKRPNQLFVETWHGGLGIKKLDGDVPKFRAMRMLMQEVRNTSRCADFFVSNSDHLTRIYRSAFAYRGKIWKVGYPKNDVLFQNPNPARAAVRAAYGLPPDCRILVYGPTFRDGFRCGQPDWRVYAVDFQRLLAQLKSKTGENWAVLVRLHPFLAEYSDAKALWPECVIDATAYPDMQELILAADAFLSDYSSCIFDAAMREIPCFTFAVDFAEYKGDRGVYYEMEELPFPYARNNDELMANIRDFDREAYLQKWAAFRERTGLYETGHAGEDIAHVIDAFLKGSKKPLEEIKSEP